MPFYIRETNRKTYLKYLIEAADKEAAEDIDGEYLGYVDGDTADDAVLHGPFVTREEALAQDVAYTEGA